MKKQTAFILFTVVYLLTAIICWIYRKELGSGIGWVGDIINLIINFFRGNFLATIILAVVVFFKTTVLTLGWVLATLKVSWLKYLLIIPIKHIVVFAYNVSKLSKKITNFLKNSIKNIWKGLLSYGIFMVIYGLPSVSLLLLVLAIISLLATGIRLFLTAKLGDKLAEILLVQTVKYLPFTGKFLNPIKNFITKKVTDIEGVQKHEKFL